MNKYIIIYINKCIITTLIKKELKCHFNKILNLELN